MSEQNLLSSPRCKSKSCTKSQRIVIHSHIAKQRKAKHDKMLHVIHCHIAQKSKIKHVKCFAWFIALKRLMMFTMHRQQNLWFGGRNEHVRMPAGPASRKRGRDMNGLPCYRVASRMRFVQRCGHPQRQLVC